MMRMYACGKFSVGRVVLRKAWAIIGGLSALAILGASGYALTQDVSRYMPGLAASLSAHSQHQVSIEGPIELDLSASLGLWVKVRDIAFVPRSNEGNEGVRPYAAELREARALVRLMPLFSRRIEIDALEIDGGVFETDSSISLVDTFQADAFQSVALDNTVRSDGWTVAALRKLTVYSSALRVLRDGSIIFQLPINNASVQPGEAGLEIKIDGLVEGRRVFFEGESGPWTAFMAGHRVYLNGKVTSESASLELTGSVADPSTHGIEFLARGGAENLDDVATLFGLGDLKRTSAMTVSAHIKVTASELSVKDLALTYGRGDLSGWFEVSSKGQTTVVDGQLVSQFLDLEAFEGGRFLHPPEKLFPDSPFPAKIVRRLKGEMSFKANTILLANARLTDGRISMVAAGGVVAINPIAISYDGGVIDASIVLDGRGKPNFKSTANLTNFNLGKLLSAAKMTDEVEARLDFGARLRGQGDTIAEMFANASGQTNLIMGQGRLSSDVLALFGGRQTVGLTAEMETAGSAEGAVELDCVVSRFDIIGGVAKSRAFLMETSQSVTTGRGSFNLGTESFDLRLVPRPKNPALLKDAADLRVTGSFIEPKFRVDKKKMSRGIAGSLGRFALAREGEARLLPLLDPEATHANACIVALTGKKPAREAKAKVYSLSQLL